MQCSLSESSGCNFVHMRTFMFHISNLWGLCLILKQHQQLLRFHLLANFSCCCSSAIKSFADALCRGSLIRFVYRSTAM
ncbi:hypothetical protein DLW34_23255 [Escherichia coli]|nr:hypothetical protein [Escherichia coli]